MQRTGHHINCKFMNEKKKQHLRFLKEIKKMNNPMRIDNWEKIEQEIQPVKCRCGGNPDFFTVSFGWGSIRCDRCDVRIPAVDCDRNDYHTKLVNDWNKAMTM